MKRPNRKTTRTAFAALALFCAAGPSLADPPAELGVKDPEAKRAVESALQTGFVSVYPVRNVLKSASPDARADLVENALAWAKAYTETPEFAASWAAARDAAKPQPKTQESIEEELAKRRRERQQQIEDAKKVLEALPPEQRQGMEEGIQAMIESSKQMDEDPAMLDIQRQGLEMQRAAEKQQHDEAMKKWEETFPADPRIAIARRLRAFLETCGDVDFAAEVVTENGRTRFTSQELEMKPKEWKLCYRAGEPAVTTARDFATAWLDEIS
jgi:hypothetical protein